MTKASLKALRSTEPIMAEKYRTTWGKEAKAEIKKEEKEDVKSDGIKEEKNTTKTSDSGNEVPKKEEKGKIAECKLTENDRQNVPDSVTDERECSVNFENNQDASHSASGGEYETPTTNFLQCPDLIEKEIVIPRRPRTINTLSSPSDDHDKQLCSQKSKTLSISRSKRCTSILSGEHESTLNSMTASGLLPHCNNDHFKPGSVPRKRRPIVVSDKDRHGKKMRFSSSLRMPEQSDRLSLRDIRDEGAELPQSIHGRPLIRKACQGDRIFPARSKSLRYFSERAAISTPFIDTQCSKYPDGTGHSPNRNQATSSSQTTSSNQATSADQETSSNQATSSSKEKTTYFDDSRASGRYWNTLHKEESKIHIKKEEEDCLRYKTGRTSFHGAQKRSATLTYSSVNSQNAETGWGEAPNWSAVASPDGTPPELLKEEVKDTELVDEFDKPRIHMSLKEVFDSLYTDSESLPVFQLILETVAVFTKRRYFINDPKSIKEARRYPILPSIDLSFILSRLDRDKNILSKADEILTRFYQVIVTSENAYERFQTIFDNEVLDLGSNSDSEPVWPLQLKVRGEPIVIIGPDVPPNSFDVSTWDSLVYNKHQLASDYPTRDGILFGVKNMTKFNNEIKTSDGQDIIAIDLLKKLFKKKVKGDFIQQGTHDALLLIPEIQSLDEWTVDVWVKFPLRGTGTDCVLLAPKNSSLGVHLMFKHRKYIGCEVPIGEDEDDGAELYWPDAKLAKQRIISSSTSRDKTQSRYESWKPLNKFCPACRVGEDGKFVVKRLDLLQGWHRIVVTCSGSRQLFYLNGLNIGASEKSLKAPIYFIGNRNPSNCAVGAIARLKIFRQKFDAENVAQLCGVTVDSTTVQIDYKSDPSWETRLR